MRQNRFLKLLLCIFLSFLILSCQNKKAADIREETYEANEIYPWLYSIYEPLGDVFCYLLLGEEKALLFDTTYGFGSLHSVVREITDLPVTVILGHGHKDHAGGALQLHSFLNSDVWLHEADFEIYQYYFQEIRLLNKLDAGQVFDLGSLHIEVIGMEGHTKGSVGLLVREHRVLLTSDSANYYIWLFLKESAPLSQYIAMLERVINLDFDTFFIGHDDVPSPKSDFQLFINAARNAKAEESQYLEQYNAFLYEENGVNIYFNDPFAPDSLRTSELIDSSLPAGNLGELKLKLYDNFRYGNGYQVLIQNKNLLNGYRLRKGDSFTLKVTYTASRDLENDLLVGFVDHDGSRWKTLSYTQKNIEPPNVILGFRSKAGEVVSSEVIINIVANASSARAVANTLYLETLGQGIHRRSNSGAEGPVIISFSEFVLTKNEQR